MASESMKTVLFFLYVLLTLALVFLVYAYHILQNISAISVISTFSITFCIYGVARMSKYGKKLMALTLLFFLIGASLGIVISLYSEFSIILFISYILVALLILQNSFLLSFSFKNYIQQDEKCTDTHTESVSVIMPCYNEGKTIRNAVENMVKQNYTNFDITIVDDGSKDNTKQEGIALAKKYPNKVHFYSKINGGKASALNYGIKNTKGEILICMDADAVFTNNGINELVHSLVPKNVGAVCGNCKVANRDNLLTNCQGSEYITAWALQSRTFAEIGCLQVVSGVMGAFKRKALEEVGYFSLDTIVEDMDLTIALQRHKWKIVFNNHAIAYVESPENIKDWEKQRYRWAYGKYQVLTKNKDMLFNNKYGNIGTIGMPYFIFSTVVNTTLMVFMGVVIVTALVANKLPILIVDIAIFALIPIGIQCYTTYIDNNNEKYHMAFYAFVQNLWYPYMMTYIDLKAFYNQFMGNKTTWNKVERLGKNTIG